MDLITSSVASYIDVWRQLGRTLAGGVVEETDGLTLVATGMRAPHYNPAFITGAQPDVARALAQARAFYGRLDLPFRLVAFEAADGASRLDAPPELGAGAVHPGMLLAPIEGQILEAPGLTVMQVDSPEALVVFHDLIAGGFGINRAVLAPLDDPAQLEEANIARYLGCVDGASVAASMRCSSGGIAVVFNIVTLAGYQRRGFGEVMTWWAVLPALDEGCLGSFLQATPAGQRLYERMGYRHIINIRAWYVAGAPPHP